MLLTRIWKTALFQCIHPSINITENMLNCELLCSYYILPEVLGKQEIEQYVYEA